MSEPPERPPQPGVETHVPKEAAAGAQAALDATFNAASGGGPDQVEKELRSQLEQHGAAGEVSEEWVTEAVRVIASGEPVAAEPGDA
jgi:hypothetical protein